MTFIRSGISIRTKMILVVAGTIILAICVTSFLIRRIVYENIIANRMRTAEILSASLVHDIKYDFDADQKDHVPDIIAKFMTYYRIIRGISFYDADLMNTADSDPTRVGHRAEDPDVLQAITKAKPSRYINRQDWSDLGIRSVEPIMQGSKIVGAIALDVSIKDVQVTLSKIDRRIAMIMGIKLLLVCTVLLILLRKTVLQRLNGLITVTQQIAAGNYDIQVLDPRRDELGELAQAFNVMTAEVKRSRQEIDDYNKHLEERVQQATAELQQAYENLKNTQGQLVLNEKMASLGVLISGIAHEINTPVGAILNVSRNLEKRIRALPNDLADFKDKTPVASERIVAFMEDLIGSSCTARHSVSYRESRAIESLLQEHGVLNPQSIATHLARLNFTDVEKIQTHMDCLRVPSFFSLAESFASIAQAVKISETSSQKISEIVRALKYFAYADKDRLDRIQINESIQTALVLLRNLLKQSVSLSVDLAQNLPMTMCTSEIHQVWTNLLTNASDAIEEMGVGHSGRIDITSRWVDDRIVVTITDNGVGIPAELLPRICDPFFTTKDIGKGTGLGLSIVSGIVKKHNGAVRIESRPGETTVEISLPVSPIAAEEDEVSPQEAEDESRAA